MPRSVVVSVGNSWGPPRTRTCGISVGPAGGFRRLTQSAVQGRRLWLVGQIRGSARVAVWVALLGSSRRCLEEILLAGCLWAVGASRGGRVATKTAVLCVGHDAVVGAAGAGAAGAGAVAAEHLRGRSSR
jgi:hypothetical protein